MSGKFAAIHSIDLTELEGGICAAYSPCVHDSAHWCEVLPYCLGTSDVLMYIAFLSSFLKEIMSQHCYHQIRRNEAAVLIHEHNAVSITIEDDSDISLCLSHKLLKILHILLHQRIRFVVREPSIHILVDICRLVCEDITYKKRGHSVGNIHCDLKRRPILLVLEKKSKIVCLDIHRVHLAFYGSRTGLTATLNPLLDLAKACIVAHRKGILSRNLKTVIFCRIMRCGNLHRSLETIVRGTEVHHRSSAESDIIHISSGICESFEKVLVYLIRRDSGISADQHLVCRKKLRKEETHLVGGFLVEIHIVDSSYVVCVKCSHNNVQIS